MGGRSPPPKFPVGIRNPVVGAVGGTRIRGLKRLPIGERREVSRCPNLSDKQTGSPTALPLPGYLESAPVKKARSAADNSRAPCASSAALASGA